MLPPREFEGPSQSRHRKWRLLSLPGIAHRAKPSAHCSTYTPGEHTAICRQACPPNPAGMPSEDPSQSRHYQWRLLSLPGTTMAQSPPLITAHAPRGISQQSAGRRVRPTRRVCRTRTPVGHATATASRLPCILSASHHRSHSTYTRRIAQQSAGRRVRQTRRVYRPKTPVSHAISTASRLPFIFSPRSKRLSIPR